MGAGRDPVDRVLDVLVSVPLCTAIAARDAVPVLARAARHRLGAVTRALLVEDDRVPRHHAVPAAGADDEWVETAESVDARVSASVAPAAAASLPIDGYDHLAARQVVDRLSSLTAEELELVADHERRHRGRRTVLGKIEQLSSS